MPIFTKIKNVDFEIGPNNGLRISFDGSYLGEPVQRHFDYYGIKYYHPFECCGMRAIASLNAFCHPEFYSEEALKNLVLMLNRLFNGGNVSFVLNYWQTRSLKPLLDNMNKIGQGLSSPVRFRNFNMNNYNYLYVWTYKGRKTNVVTPN